MKRKRFSSREKVSVGLFGTVLLIVSILGFWPTVNAADVGGKIFGSELLSALWCLAVPLSFLVSTVLLVTVLIIMVDVLFNFPIVNKIMKEIKKLDSSENRWN